MIIYFSATGNCEYIAQKIAASTDDRAVSITDISDEIILGIGESLGIVVPTYFWGLPSIVEDFIGSVKIQNADSSYIYLVATYGTTVGQIDTFTAKLLKRQSLSISASFSIKTVDNYTVLFSVTDKEKIANTLKHEEHQLDKVISAIKTQQHSFISKDKKSMFMSRCARHFYDKARLTSHLHVLSNCIGCGICSSDCPVCAIDMVDGKPEWTKDKCTMCLRCLHRCPQFAIQYDNKTQNNGQYLHPKDS